MGSLYYLFTFFLYFVYCKGNNLALDLPILKSFSEGSYFGYAVAQHIIDNGDNQDYVILVGAPKSNYTSSNQNGISSAMEPGALLRCPFTTAVDDCEYVPFETVNDDDYEYLNNMWYGASITTSASLGNPNSPVVACAHRYVAVYGSAQNRRGVGMCSEFYNDLYFRKMLLPVESLRPQLQGLLKKGELCSFAYGQVGASVALDDDDVLFMGAPGAHTWHGSAFRYQLNAPIGGGSDSAYLPPHECISKIQNGREIYELPKEGPVHSYYSYGGMAVTLMTYPNGTKVYITGSPKEGNTGIVTIYQYDPDSTPPEFSFIYERDVLSVSRDPSNFGTSLAVVDVNGDGQPDLVVGAPLYTQAGSKSKNKRAIRDGAVFVYMNQGAGIHADIRPIRLSPSEKLTADSCYEVSCYDNRFGEAVARLGDLNLDGFEDFGVGAPFEEEGQGAVYIFYGSAEGPSDDNVLRIAASGLSSSVLPLQGFGHSLAGGVDMDGNTYPDLVVGAFESSKVVVFLSRPVVTIDASITTNPERLDPNKTRCLKDGKGKKCFIINLCLGFTVKPENLILNPSNIKYELTVDGDASGAPRVEFKSSPNSNRLENVMPSDPQCVRYEVFIKEGNRDILTPISIKVDFSLADQPTMGFPTDGSIPNINDFPVLSDTHFSHLLMFQSSCNSQVCQSNLQLEATFLDLDRDLDGKPVIVPGEMEPLRLEFRITNRGEAAHQSTLHLHLPETLSYVGPEDKHPVACQFHQQLSRADCNLGNPLNQNKAKPLVFVIRMEVQAGDIQAERVNVTAYLSTTSEDVTPDNDRMELFLQVKPLFDLGLYVQGSPSYIDLDEQHNTRISQLQQTIFISNDGPSDMRGLSVNIKWPLKRKDDEFLIYLSHIEYSDSEEHQCEAFEYSDDDPLQMTALNIYRDLRPPSFAGCDSDGRVIYTGQESEDIPYNTTTTTKRRKRAPEEDVKEEPVPTKVLDRLRCGDDVKCAVIKCHVDGLVNVDTKNIKFYGCVQERVAMELLGEEYEAEIVTSASLQITELKFKDSESNLRDNSGELVFSLRTPAAVDPISIRHANFWKWILIAIVIGIMIIAIIMIILWKCGFFKRRSRLMMQKAERKPQGVNDQKL